MRSIVVVVAAFLATNCGSSCFERILSESVSPNTTLRAVVSARTCGTADGFIVDVIPVGKSDEFGETAFMAKISRERDTSNPENAGAVRAHWESDRKLVISYAAWIEEENRGYFTMPKGRYDYDVEVEYQVLAPADPVAADR